ncbi:MAG: heterodisulfide reductase-related iron-sulfur binding cluster [Acidobacteriaceae bacterium]
MRISLLITYTNDTLFPEIGIAVVRMLRRLGHTIDFPYAQTCCGQVHCNTGYQPEAIPLVRRFVKVFRDSEVVL